jgi:hypothetical protein
MGQDHPPGVDLRQMRFQRLQAEVVLHDLVVIVGLGNEQVGAARC